MTDVLQLTWANGFAWLGLLYPLVVLSCRGELLSAGVMFSIMNLDVEAGEAGLDETLGLAALVWAMSLPLLATALIEEALEWGTVGPWWTGG